MRTALPAPFLALTLALASVLAAMPACAAPQAWTVDHAASRLGFKAAMNGVGFDGVFKRWDAAIAFDPQDLKDSRAVVGVDLSSTVTGDPTRDEALPTDDWFAVKRFPKAVFASRSIGRTGPDRYVAQGDLTIRGARRPATLNFTLHIDHGVAHLDGTAAVDRIGYGVGQGQFKGPETVAAAVVVVVHLTAKAGK